MRTLVGQSEDGTWHRLKDPFEVVISLLLLIASIVQLVFEAPPDSLASLLPDWAQLAWLITILLSSGAILGGLLWRNLISGMFIESVGLSGMSMSLVTYGLAILVSNKLAPGAMVSATSIIALGAAFGWKRVQLKRVLGVLPT